MQAAHDNAAVTAAPRPETAIDATHARLVLWLLTSAAFATVAGMAAATFRGDGTAINAFLFLSCEWPLAVVGRTERAAMLLVLGFAFAGLFWRRWPVLLPVAAYVFAEVMARRVEGGQLFSEWAPLTHAPRYLTPLAAIALSIGFARGRSGQWWRSAGEWTLRAALAIVFAAHGLECIKGHPGFVDLVLSSARNLAGIRISESTALAQLEVIGVVDCVVAGAVLLWPHRGVLLWAAFWGAVSAFSRVTANGWTAYPDVLVRATHVLIPLALVFLERREAEGTPDAADVRAELGNESSNSVRSW